MLRAISWVMCILALVGCVSKPVRESGSWPASTSQVTSAELAFEAALEAWRRGESEHSENILTQARQKLDTAVSTCLTDPNCDQNTAMQAQSTALKRMQLALIGRSTFDSEENVTAEPMATTSAATPLVTLPEVARSMALLKGQKLTEVIRLNEAVKASIEEWLTWMRPNLLDAYEHYQYLRHKMWPVYESAGLPEALLFGILAKESGGKVHAFSRAGAAGLLQFMPATAARFGLTSHNGFDERLDPQRITEANVAFLNEQFRAFNNDLELALAAYNGGEGRVGRLARGGEKSFWDAPVYSALPPETRDYVPMVLAAAWLYLHPDDYGLVFPQIDSSPSTITLERTASINELAVCMGQFGNSRGWFRTLRNLNPKTEADTRLPVGTIMQAPQAAAEAYAARCRSGLLVQRSTELHDARKPANAGLAVTTRVAGDNSALSGNKRVHLVRKGETLHAIARRFGCSVPAVAKVNDLRAPHYTIRSGQRLKLPSCGRA